MKIVIHLFLCTAALLVTPHLAMAAGPEIWETGCTYLQDKQVKADVPCILKVYANATSATEVWEWDNGNHTVLKMSDDGIFVNDQPAEKFDATSVLDVENPSCYKIKNTNKIYCSGT